MKTFTAITYSPEGNSRSSVSDRSSSRATIAKPPEAAAAASDVLTAETGVTRTFGAYDIGMNGLLSGWAPPEEAHIWNDGPQAVLKLRMPMPRGRVQVTVDGTPFLNASCNHQDVTLYANGFFVGTWRLSEVKDYQLVATLEPEQLHSRDGMATAKLVWHIPTSMRPSDVAASSDTRELGFCFRFFSVTEEG